MCDTHSTVLDTQRSDSPECKCGKPLSMRTALSSSPLIDAGGEQEGRHGPYASGELTLAPAPTSKSK
jgi:hypothetical protein